MVQNNRTTTLPLDRESSTTSEGKARSELDLASSFKTNILVYVTNCLLQTILRKYVTLVPC